MTFEQDRSQSSLLAEIASGVYSRISVVLLLQLDLLSTFIASLFLQPSVPEKLICVDETKTLHSVLTPLYFSRYEMTFVHVQTIHIQT